MTTEFPDNISQSEVGEKVDPSRVGIATMTFYKSWYEGELIEDERINDKTAESIENPVG